MYLRQTIKRKCKGLIQLRNELLVRNRYAKDIRRLREKVKSKKLNVVFYTNEPQKWTYDSVYRELEKSPFFSPLILVVPRYRVHTGRDNTRMSLEEQYNFYKERNYNVKYGYEEGRYLDLKTFNPDIIFYLQLAEVPGIDSPVLVSKYALTFYCSYAYQLADYQKQYLQSFHKLLYLNYLEHEKTINIVNSYKKGNSRNCLSVGYPRLDVYNRKESHIDLKKYWKKPDKIKIIYAPHHSFQKSPKNIFNFSTFNKNYKFILELAKRYSDITTWIFKPHPMLRHTIISERLMTEQEAEEYYNQWSLIGNKYDTGDYFDVFKSSDLMITDCSSFLAEYFPSRHPIIRLINPKACEFNELGKQLSEGFYNVHNNEELEHVFKQLVIYNNDELAVRRKEIAKTLINPKQTAGGGYI